jgi:hypothetical protein
MLGVYDDKLKPVGLSLSQRLFGFAKEKEPEWEAALSVSVLVLQFYKSPIPREEHAAHNGRPTEKNKRPDLDLMAALPSLNPKLAHRARIQYRRRPQEHLWLSAEDVPTGELEGAARSGKILGIPDLSGAQLFVIFSLGFVGGDGEGPPLKVVLDRINQLKTRMKLGKLTLTLAQGREYLLEVGSAAQHIGGNGEVVFVYTFPEDIESLSAYSRAGR